MRRTASLILLIALLMMTGCGEASDAASGIDNIKTYQEIPGVTYDEISAIEKLKLEYDSLTFGHLLEMEAFLLPDGTYAGFTSEFCLFLTNLFGIEFIQIPYDSWQQLKKDVDDCIIGFTGDLTPNTQRKTMYHMTEPIAERMQKIFTLTDNDITTEDEVNGLKLGFLENSINIETILYRYPDLSFEAIPVDRISSIERMLISGEIDAFVTERNLDMFFDGNERIQSKDFFPLAYTPVSLATNKPELASVISVIDKYLEAGGIDILNNMYQTGEYEYAKHRLLRSFTDEELAYLNDLSAQGGSVSVAFESDNYPFSFYNTTEKEFQGIAVDILNEISGLTGVRFTNMTTSKSTWTEILDAVKTKQASVVSQLGYTKQREDDFIWSALPYSRNNNYVLISKIDFPKMHSYQIPRMKVGVTDNTVYKDVYLDWFPDSDNLVPFPVIDDALDALENGDVDLVMCAENVLLTQINYREKTGYIINYRFTQSMDAMYGFSKDETVLRSIMDKAQQHIDMESIEGYWKGRVFDYSTAMAKMQMIYLSVFACGIFIVLIALMFLFIRNSRLRSQLVEHSTTLSTIYSSIPDTIFSKNAEGAYTSCNPSFEKQVGLPEKEIIGKTYAEIFRDRASKTVNSYREIDKKVITSGQADVVEETVIYPDGSQRILETLKAPLIQNGKPVGLLGIGRDITERVESKGRLERIINTAQIAFILSIDGTVIEANEYSLKHINVQIGTDLHQVYSEPEQRDAIIRIAEEQGTASNIIVKFNMANGESHRFLASFAFVEYEQRNAYLVWAIDIEQDERKQERLYAAQQSFQSVLDVLPMPVRIVDRESGEIVYVNDSLLELLEYEKAEEICGLHITDILPPIMLDGSNSADRAGLIMKSDDSIAVEMDYCTKNGEIIEAMAVTRQIDYMGRPSSIGIIKDLTAEKEREQVLRESAEREKEANQTKTLFLANMSHEIRTPMNGVIGMTELLLGEELSGRQLQYVKDIKISAESLLGIINDILDLSKITEGRLQITPVDIDLSILLKNIVSMMSFTARSKGLEFIDDVHVNVPEYVCVDDLRLKQILVNLLSNAIKFTKEGYVKFSAKIENGIIAFAISDTGIGIKQEEIPMIFMAFEQADRRKNRAIKGTGLGLSISKSLIDLMSGRIWVESEYGKGTTFFASVPYVQGDESAVEIVDSVFEYITAPLALVLLVDDIQTNLTVGSGLLRNCKITADIAISGREAIELVKAKDYDIVFMDHMMPDMDGIETTEAIRGMGEKYSELPIIALTANAVNESKELLLSSGMNDFLSKPIDKNELMVILKKWLPEDKVEIGTKLNDDKEAEPYSGVLEAASKIDGLDIKLALNRISGMQDVLEASLQQVADSVTERIKRMDESLDGNDLRSFGIDAHGFKGALANIGAIRNSELAAGLEIAAKAENMPQCIERFTIFASEMESFAGELKSIFPQQQIDDKLHGDNDFLKLKISEAIGYLSRFEAADALKCLSALEDSTFGNETDSALAEAVSLIKSFKYKKAGRLLQSIIK